MKRNSGARTDRRRHTAAGLKPRRSAIASFDLSPDGKLCRLCHARTPLGHKDTLVLVNTESGTNGKVLDFERLRFGLVRFSRDGKAVVYPTRENGVDNLWLAAAGWIEGKTDHGFHLRTHLRLPLVIRRQAACAGSRPYRLRCGFDPRRQAVRSAVIFYPKNQKAAIPGRLFLNCRLAKWFRHPSRSRPASPSGL